MEIDGEVLYIILAGLYFVYGLWKNLKKKNASTEEEPELKEVSVEEPEERPHRREVVSKPFDERVGKPLAPSTPFGELLEEMKGTRAEAEQKAGGKLRKVREAEEEFESVESSEEPFRSDLDAEKRIRETELRKVVQERTSAAERAELAERELRRKQEQEVFSEANKGRLEPYGLNEPAGSRRRKEILKLLSSTESLKSTFVASEILKRKYF